MYKHSIKAVFTVVKPFDFDGLDAGQLKTDDNGNMIAINLFEQFHWVSIDDVTQSSCRFHVFGDDASCFKEDLKYSLAYFEKNIELSLYARAYGDILRYNKKSHGGPLLRKGLRNQ